MNVVFLDYDGVVNTPMWNKAATHCGYNFPEDGKVNNFQCVQWVSEFCEKCGYEIVVSSTWRMDENYIDCLTNGGLRSGLRVIGKTPVHWNDHATRGEEINDWLTKHPEVELFLIFDDEDDFDCTPELRKHLILCDPTIGFGMTEFYKAQRLHESLKSKEFFTMRDPNRIDRFCDELKSVWHCVPDWRFGQLMMSLLEAYKQETGRDFFYKEDDDLMEFFIQYISENTGYVKADEA